MTRGIVLSGPDKTIQARAKNSKLAVTVSDALPLAYDRTLFVDPGIAVPWDLLPAAWNFLERWDAAVPLWRYGVNASDVGSQAEKAQTQAIVRDLRVLLHSVELLFVRDNADGRALVAAYRVERATGGEKRLAFLRAYYQTKPRLCVLPITWLADVHQRSKQSQTANDSRRRRSKADLVTIELEPGRWAKVDKNDVEKVLAEHQQGRRR